MERRAFLRLLGLGVASAATLDVEQLLWVPKPMITVPAMPTLTRVHDSIVVHGPFNLEQVTALLKDIYLPAVREMLRSDAAWVCNFRR